VQQQGLIRQDQTEQRRLQDSVAFALFDPAVLLGRASSSYSVKKLYDALRIEGM
jgi:hypothetical protein